LIQHALGAGDSFSWGLFASNFAFQDEVELLAGQTAIYSNFGFNSVTKWQHHECFPNGQPPEGGFAVLSFDDVTRAGRVSAYTPDGTGAVNVSWTRFGVTDLSAVPAWRQSLYGAFSLSAGYPSAAIVLMASAFEAFFMESMRLEWEDSGRDLQGFDKLSGDNIRITSLVTWLPQALGLQQFSPAACSNWKSMVNGRRNDVVHKARIDFKPEEAAASMKAAIEAIVAIDPLALVRPHPYYRTTTNAGNLPQGGADGNS
jgi:hypothetical protein